MNNSNMLNERSNHYICRAFSSDTSSSDTRYCEVHGDGPEFIQSNANVVQPSSSAAPLTSEELVRLLHQALAPAKTSFPQSGGGYRIEFPTYHGKENESLSLWLFQVEQLFSAKNTPDSERLAFISAHLRDAALGWYHNTCLGIQQGQRLPFSSWNMFAVEIRQAFEPPRHQQLLRTQLRSLKQTGSAMDYAHRFRLILEQIISMDEADKINYFINGLNSRLRSNVEIEDPSSLELAIKIAVTIDSSRSASHMSGKDWSIDSTAQHSGPTPMELGNVVKKERIGDKQKICNYCKKKGHLDADCYSLKAKNRSSQNLNNLVEGDDKYLSSINGNKNSLIVFKGLINGHPARILIDSGASFDHISTEFSKKANLQETTGESQQVTLADGKHCGISKKVNSSITIGKFSDKVTFSIFPLKTCDAILGKPWLFRHNPIANWRENT